MRFLTAFMLWLALSLPSSAQFYPTSWYWVVNDSMPTVQVWNGATGAFVSNTNGAYETWLTAISTSPFSQAFSLASPICAVTNNGNAKPRITLCNSIINNFGWGTGAVKTIFGTCSTNATGSLAITQVSANQVDLNGAVFDSSCGVGGVIGSATAIDTAANLNSFINSFVLPCYFQNSASANTQTSAANIVLSNPAARLQVITMSTTGKNVQMPQANLFTSCFPVGWPVVVNNPGTNAFAVTDFGAMSTLAASVAAGTTWEFYLTGNASQQGTWKAVQVQ